MEEANAIDFIIVLPYTDRRVKYKLNDAKDIYTKRIEDMYNFCLNYISKYHKEEINELLWSFRPFLIDVQKDSILELEENRESKTEKREKELDLLRKEQEKVEQKEVEKLLNVKKVSHKSSITPYWKN